MRKNLVLMLLLSAMTITSCGGGGGGGGTGGTNSTPQPTTAVVKLSTAVTGVVPSGTVIASYDVTLTLPSGVTVKSTTAPPQTDSGVVTATGAAAGSSLIAVYTAATANASGTLRIQLANGSGFSAGEFATINCDIAAGSNPSTADFMQPSLKAGGFDTLTNSSLDLTGQLALSESVTLQ